MKSKESAAVKRLLNQSSAPYKHILNGRETVDISAWRPVRPGAVYDLSTPHPGPPPQAHRLRTLRQRPALGLGPTVQVEDTQNYMSGEIDDHFNYIYRRKRPNSDGPLHHFPPPPPPTSYRHRLPFTVHLDPVLPYRSADHMEADARMDLARIVAMQLKPELLVEQIVLENRLRTMSLNNLHHLSLDGIGVDPRAIHDLDRGALLKAVKSKSTPLLPGLQTQHRKTNKRKSKLQELDWCTLNMDVPYAGQPTNSTVLEGILTGTNYVEKKKHLGRDNTLLQEGGPSLANSTTTMTGTRYRIPQPLSSRQQVARQPQVAGYLQQPSGSIPPGAISALERDPANLRVNVGDIPVVAPLLGSEGASVGGHRSRAQLMWQQNKVKYKSKLKSLGW